MPVAAVVSMMLGVGKIAAFLIRDTGIASAAVVTVSVFLCKLPDFAYGMVAAGFQRRGRINLLQFENGKIFGGAEQRPFYTSITNTTDLWESFHRFKKHFKGSGLLSLYRRGLHS
jgi:hypothetical protein